MSNFKYISPFGASDFPMTVYEKGKKVARITLEKNGLHVSGSGYLSKGPFKSLDEAKSFIEPDSPAIDFPIVFHINGEDVVITDAINNTLLSLCLSMYEAQFNMPPNAKVDFYQSGDPGMRTIYKMAVAAYHFNLNRGFN